MLRPSVKTRRRAVCARLTRGRFIYRRKRAIVLVVVRLRFPKLVPRKKRRRLLHLTERKSAFSLSFDTFRRLRGTEPSGRKRNLTIDRYGTALGISTAFFRFPLRDRCTGRSPAGQPLCIRIDPSTLDFEPPLRRSERERERERDRGRSRVAPACVLLPPSTRSRASFVWRLAEIRGFRRCVKRPHRPSFEGNERRRKVYLRALPTRVRGPFEQQGRRSGWRGKEGKDRVIKDPRGQSLVKNCSQGSSGLPVRGRIKGILYWLSCPGLSSGI